MKDYLEFIPNKFPEDYTMRAEKIRNWLKGIAFCVLMLAVLLGMLWGLP